jgi:hypothetical protein
MWFGPFPFRFGVSVQNIVDPECASSFHHSIFSPAPIAAGGHHHPFQEERQTLQFIALLDSYRESGALRSGLPSLH